MSNEIKINIGLILLSNFIGFAWGYTKAREKFLEALIRAIPDQDASNKEG